MASPSVLARRGSHSPHDAAHAHHIAERLALGSVTYALFALESGNEEHLAAAKAQLAAEE